MAGWICQTRKIISAVMFSLADDLEQTVQELNDVMYRLGSTPEDRSSSQSDTLPDNITQNERPHAEQTSPHQLKATFHEPRPDDEHQASVSREQLTATQTTQPQASGFPSTLNARLSQSTPALQICEDTRSVARDKCVRTRQLMLQSPLHSLISSSSPCLMDTSVAPVRPSDRASVGSSEHRVRHPHLCSKSLKQTMASATQKVCPCHRQDSFKITRGLKLPGRVVRAQSSITQDQGRSPTREDSTQSPAVEEHNYSFNQSSCAQIPGGKADQNVDSLRCASDVKDGEPESQRAGQAASSLMLVEHLAPVLRWPTLRPLTRMLSLAFAQLANVALMFSDSAASVHRLTSSADTLATESTHHEMASAMHPLGTGEHGQMGTTCKPHVSEKEAQQLSVLQRTCSTDSFEIIEAPWPDGAAEGDKSIHRIVSQCLAHQAHAGSVCEAPGGRLDSSSSLVCCAQPQGGGSALPDMSTSSTDFVCFDFRKLLIDDQFRAENPMLQSSSRGSPGLNSCIIDSGVLLVGGDCFSQSVSGDSSSRCQHLCHHDTGRDNNNDDDDDDDGDDDDGDNDDDDGDSNASFIILTGNDMNNAEFIC